jgi:hypothetical protein
MTKIRIVGFNKYTDMTKYIEKHHMKNLGSGYNPKDKFYFETDSSFPSKSTKRFLK